MYLISISFAYTANKRAISGYFRVHSETYFFRLKNRVHFRPSLVRFSCLDLF